MKKRNKKSILTKQRRMTKRLMAEYIRTIGGNLWKSSFFTGTSSFSKDLYKEMSAPKVGDLVMEISTWKREPAINAVGFLVRRNYRISVVNRTWSIRTFEGKIINWKNCCFIKICSRLVNNGKQTID